MITTPELPENFDIAELRSEILFLKNMVMELKEELTQVKKERDELKEEVKRLKSQLNLNSQNSSKPPSSDGLKKIEPAFPRSSTGNKPGGQPGHKAHKLQKVDNPDKIVICRANTCTCGCCLETVEGQTIARRQKADMPKILIETTEYQVQVVKCPNCGAVNRGTFPEDIKADMQYGARVKAFTVLLRNMLSVPYAKVCELFYNLTQFRLNASTVYNNDAVLFDKLKPIETLILVRLLQSNAAHSDETGMRCEGTLKWLHVFSNNLFTYLFLHDKRGKQAIESEYCHLHEYNGWLIHDCWSSYFNITSVKHAVCGAHLLRELKALMEGQSVWAEQFHAFLLRVKGTEFEKRIAQRSEIEAEFDQIIQQGQQEEPLPQKNGKKGRVKRTKGRNLLERLEKLKESVLAFAFNAEVPFTNNQAERDIRPTKTKMKVSGCFRDFQSGQMFARIHGFISTVKKHGQSVFDTLVNVFEGKKYVVV